MAKTNDKKGLLSTLASLLGVNIEVKDEAASPVNFTLKTSDGQEITIDKPEGEDVEVGDSASPDGTFTLEDGRTITIEDGVVTEILPAEEPSSDPDPDEETEALRTENASLKARISELEQNAVTDEQRTILDKVAKAGGLAWLNKVAQSGYTPAARKTNSTTVNKGKSKLSSRLEELRGENA